MASVKNVLNSVVDIQQKTVAKLNNHDQQIVSLVSMVNTIKEGGSIGEGDESFLNLLLDEINGNTSPELTSINEILDQIIG